MPQEKTPRQSISTNRIIAFPRSISKTFDKKRAEWLQLHKSPYDFSGKSFNQAKEKALDSIDEFFHFLPDDQMEVEEILIAAFHKKIKNGEITNIPQIKSYLQKVEELAQCIQLFLHKNEYNEIFTSEVSLDIFKKGFSPKSPQEIKRKYPNYFTTVP